MKNLKNAVGYLRVSTDGQVGEDKFGLESQRQQIERFAATEGYTISEWYTDEGISGVADNKPALDEIIYGEVSNPPVEAVLVAKTDRISRDMNGYFYYKMLLHRKNIRLVSISEDFGIYGEFSSLLEAFTLFVADQERKNITKRTSAGRMVKGGQGGYAGGRPPLGYKVVNKQLVVDVENAEIIRLVFLLREDGMVMDEIADHLNERGFKSQTGKRFRSATVSTILANRKIYEGWYRYGGGEWVEGLHEAII